MYLVDGNRRREPVISRSVIHPAIVVPMMMVESSHDGTAVGPQLGAERVRITLHQRQVPRPWPDFVLVNRALGGTWHKQFPYTRWSAIPHRVRASIPVIEVSHNAYAHRVRRPYCKLNARHAFNNHWVCAHLIVFQVVGALADQVQIKVRKERRKCVRIVELARGLALFYHSPAITSR